MGFCCSCLQLNSSQARFPDADTETDDSRASFHTVTRDLRLFSLSCSIFSSESGRITTSRSEQTHGNQGIVKGTAVPGIP